jgi:DNA-binding NarL/FixJ family response regulator
MAQKNSNGSSNIQDKIKTQVGHFDQVTIVGEADSGRSAMKMMLEFNPDLVILDIHMTEEDGLDALKKIKESDVKTKVCVLTSHSYPNYKARCLTMGADFFLNKADDKEKVNVIIATMLKEKGLPE